ncbi:MAG: hypothetical protein PHE43_01390 [Candidatus Nanoarchaeia archaeon]|nr:hypothetical protein [Candidatus Nanoarchaeia archaeon]
MDIIFLNKTVMVLIYFLFIWVSIPIIIYSSMIIVNIFEYLFKKRKRIKNKIKGYWTSYKGLAFSLHFTFLFFLALIIFKLFIIRSLEFGYFLPLWFVSLSFIKLSKAIIQTKKGDINELKFFCFILGFGLILLGYILSFSLLYLPSNYIGYGGFNDLDGNPYTLDFGHFENIYYSGFTFFSMEYDNISSEGILKFFSLAEVALAQLVIITFIGIMAGELIEKIKLKEVK